MQILGPPQNMKIILTIIKIGFKMLYFITFYSTTAIPYLPKSFLHQSGELWVGKRQKYLCVQAYINKCNIINSFTK